jgi:cell wall-associated NlpC family hydrolase
MKKFSLMLAVSLLFVSSIFLTACGGDSDKGDSTPNTTTESQQTTPEETTATPPSETSDTTTQAPTEPATTPPQLPQTPVDENNAIVRTALAMIGVPFTDGGSSPETGFDSSGFIYYVLRENGYINCPRLISEQAAMGENIGYDRLQPGDVVFFSSDDSKEPHYGGIYIGDGKMIYAPMPGEVVREANISGQYWKDHFATAVSLQNDE